MASTYLEKTFGSDGNRQTYTVSAWVKRSELGRVQVIFFAGDNSQDTYPIHFLSDDRLDVTRYSSGYTWRVTTSRVFRDTSAWYHIVVAVDTTQATASDRVKIYVNGIQETSLDNTSYPTQNSEYEINDASFPHRWGHQTASNNFYYNGVMAHCHFIDGTAYDASYFGQTETASGIWKPKTSPSVTYGTNGFFLKFGNSGSLGTDSSGNGNNLTVNGTGTQTLDTPSNVFATLNALNKDGTYSNGNLTVVTPGATRGLNLSTLGVSKGKYYWEVKATGTNNTSNIGIIADKNDNSTGEELGHTTQGYAYVNFNGYIRNNDAYSITSGFATYTTNDIIGVALDLDNNNLYFAKNGTWQNSGDPTSGATGTGAISITDPTSTATGFYFAAVSDFSPSVAESFNLNFGNGYFGTTAVASANSDSAGLGKFEYAVPSGYYALCTKNIASYG